MRSKVLSQLVMPAASALTPFKTWSYLKEMCQSDFESPQRQRTHRMALIRELLVHAYREVDIYRAALDRAGVDPIEVAYPRTFMRLPITSKNDLRTGFPDRQVARSARSGWLRYSNTTGTMGRPLILVQDVADVSWKYASILRSRVLAGVDPMGTQVRISPNECQPCLPQGDSPERIWPLQEDRAAPGRRSAMFLFLERQVISPLFHRRIRLDPFWEGSGVSGPVDYGAYLRRIDELAPEVLSLYPLYALLLAKHLRRTGDSPPRVTGVIDFYGGVCTPKLRKLVHEAFAVPTAQACGSCEFARYAASCTEDLDRMHLAEGYCYVEAVRPDGGLCASGELGNLIVTSLHSQAMPIIRLEPGDVGRIIEDACACGRRSRRLTHGGRIQALIKNADGDWVTAADLWDELLFIPGVELFQLVQKTRKKYLLRIIPEPDRALDVDALQSVLERLLGRDAQVEREVVPGLVPEASGKLQLVKSNTFEAFRPVQVAARDIPVN